MSEFLGSLWQWVITPIGTVAICIILATISLVFLAYVMHEFEPGKETQMVTIGCKGFLATLGLICGDDLVELISTRRWLGTLLLVGIVCKLIKIFFQKRIVIPMYLAAILTSYGIYKLYHMSDSDLFWAFFWTVTSLWILVCLIATIVAIFSDKWSAI